MRLLLLTIALMACSDDESSTAAGDATPDAAMVDGAPPADTGASDASPPDEPTQRPASWTAATHEKGAPNYDLLFDDTRVHRIDLTMSADDWRAIQADLDERIGPFGEPGSEIDIEIPEEAYAVCEGIPLGDDCAFEAFGLSLMGRCSEVPVFERPICVPNNLEELGLEGLSVVEGDPIYVPVTVAHDDGEWLEVGLRFKGNASLRQSWQDGRLKLGFRLHFDKFEDDHPALKNQRFHGFKKMTFAPGFGDPSYLRDKLTADLFRAQGVPAAHVAFYEVWVDVGEGPGVLGPLLDDRGHRRSVRRGLVRG